MRKFQTTEDARIQKIADSCLPDQVTVLVSSDVAVPMVTGIRRAYVYVPPLALSDGEWRLVLRHEYQHFRGKDIYIKLFYLILEAVFWWNPVVRFFHRELENLLELRCDSAMTKAMTEKERVTYLEAILNVMKQVAWRDVKQLNGAASLVDVKRQGFMRQRFEVILNKAAVSKGRSIRNVCIIVIVFVCSYFVVVQPGWYPTVEDHGGGEIVEVTKENAYIRVDKNGTYQLYVDGKIFGTVEEKDLDVPPHDELDIIREE
ncbi:M56 family metallopeptidase [Clostridiales bacterium]|nr:M56 family metallopeptidase [Clostridiales bacterium]